MLARWQPGHVKEWLTDLERSGKAQVLIRGGQRFRSCAEARYVDDALSQCHRDPSRTEGAQT